MHNDIPAAQPSGGLREFRDHTADASVNSLQELEPLKAVGKGRAVIASLPANPRHHILKRRGAVKPTLGAFAATA
jgi:hypothetical protein